jgi:hypothetical protein
MTTGSTATMASAVWQGEKGPLHRPSARTGRFLLLMLMFHVADAAITPRPHDNQQ